MLKSLKASRHRYDQYIQSNKERAEKEIEKIQKKKKNLEDTVTCFDQESLKLALKAEETGNLKGNLRSKKK